MSKNKYMDKAGVYDLLESKYLDDLTERIEASVSSLEGRLMGGETEASEAYQILLSELPDGFLVNGIEFMEMFIETCEQDDRMGGWLTGNASKNLAKLLCENAKKGDPFYGEIVS